MIDLLAPPENIGVAAAKLGIIDDGRGGVGVKNLSMHVADTEEDALNQLFEGEINRTYASHKLNSHSSRSHAVYTLHIESRSRVESTEKMTYAKLHLVDLAGSERLGKTGTQGSQLNEARYINKSLTYLEQVVLALSDRNRDHIPYRQAMLTNFLRDSLGGNCMTVMVANVHVVRDHIEETISTLKFSTRMMKVTNEATVNVMMDPSLAIKRYEKEIRDLKQELAMHDTLANRGRVNYDSYSNEELMKVKTVTHQFLSGEIDEIPQMDSLRMIREIFCQIKNEYRMSS
jgi:kinesin family protein 6/9